MHFNSFFLALAASQLLQTIESKETQQSLNNGLGKTPALGWNSWNVGGCAYADAATALKTANLFISLGLKDLGYKYVNIDDCWSSKSRDASSHLVPDPAKWPNGMKNVTDQIHSLGLKFGLYGCAGNLTCAGYPGSRGRETIDAETLASWGVDYWKYDNCNTPTTGSSQTWYTTMSKALQRAGRPILFSLCNWGRDDVWTWGASVGNSWRMSSDVSDNWASVASIASAASALSRYAGPGGFNDLDMMEIGNGGLTENEERAHMGLWALAKSPIILGTDLSKISASSLAIIKNKGILSISQDSLGKAATYFVPSGAPAPVDGQLYPYWAGPLSDGIVVGVVASGGASMLSFDFADVPGVSKSGSYKWTEMYTGATGTTSGTVTTSLAAHDMRVYKISQKASRSYQ